MKNLDTFSKRLFVSAISIGIVLIAASLFVFSLAAVAKSFAKENKAVIQTPPTKAGYTIIGAYEKDGKVYAVGFKDSYSDMIQTFSNPY